MNLKSFILASFLILNPLSNIDDEDIAIRHDVDPEKYLELGQKFPEVGKVGKNGGDGTLIAPQWVVTAAHVAEGMTRRTQGNFSVWFQNDEIEARVTQVILNPGFRPMGPHDIALLKLEQPISSIEPVGLYDWSDELSKEIVLVGHGDTKRGTGGNWEIDRMKRGATNKIDEVNNHHIQFTFDAPDSEQTTDLEGTAGPGDSGGPAFIVKDGQNYVAGISSLGQPGSNGPGTYGAKENYVRVSQYIDWLQSMMDNPPQERLVNFGQQRSPGNVQVRRGLGGPMPEGMSRIDEWGLIMKEANGALIMAGKVDPLVPEAINKIGIRPPAKLISVDGKAVSTVKELKELLAGMDKDQAYKVVFEFQGKSLTAELNKK